MSYLIPRTDDPSRKHKKVTHGNQAGPDDEGEDTEELLKDRLDTDEHKHSQEDGQCRRHGDDKGHVVLHVLRRWQKNTGHRMKFKETIRETGLTWG